MQPFGAPEGLIIFYLLFCAEIDQIKVHQSCSSSALSELLVLDLCYARRSIPPHLTKTEI